MTSTETHPDLLAEQPDDPLNESLLLQAVRDGSTAAFGILYARHRSFAVGVANRALAQADAALAEDVVEVSFIRVLTALRNGRGPSDTLRSYLATTVRREAWRAQRRRRRQAEVAEQWAVGEERALEPDTEPPADLGRDLGSHVLLGEAFRGLSDRWRHVLWLTAVEGRKPAEVAPMLGLSAGSASALAYRARNGLIAAYVAVYRRSTDDEACVAGSERLEQYVAAGAPEHGYPDVVAHLDGCASCRDVSRGVDVLGSVLASMAPLGLLTAGAWGSAGIAGTAGVAGVAGVAGTAGTAPVAAGSAAATVASTSGVGIGGAIAAAAAVTVLAGAAWFGLARSPGTSSADAAPPAATSSAPGAVPPLVTTPGSRTPDGTSTARPTAPVSTTRPAGPTRPETTVAPSTTIPGAPAGSSPGVPVTATTTPTATPTATTPTTAPPSSTSTTLPPAGPGSLTGRVVRVSPDDPEGQSPAPVSSVQVVAYDSGGRLAAAAATASDGRWALPDLAPDRYLVVAIVPATYRPASGPDPWVGGATWGAMLGSVELADAPLDLVDLRLVER